ncbi:hypothetical protein [Streptomyces sp. NPDC053079]|uniref:hypothetical protein n=1 Tax=Streptomyces sp. NPDC053079 TaxID=3365697 RepID=UPI0037D00311
MNTELADMFAFAVTMAACVTLIFADHVSPADFGEYAAALTGVYTVWHNRPRL